MVQFKSCRKFTSTFIKSAVLVISEAPRLIGVLFILIVVQSLAPIASLAMLERLVRAIVSTGIHANSLLLLVGWVAAISIPFLLNPVVQVTQSATSEKLRIGIMRRIIQTSWGYRDLHPYDDPKLLESIEVLSREAPFRPLNFIVTSTELLRTTITAISLAIYIAQFSQFLAPLMFIAFVPLGISMATGERRLWQQAIHKAGDAVMMRYIVDMSVDNRIRAEIIATNLHPDLVQKYKVAANSYFQHMNVVRVKNLLRIIPYMVLSLVALGLIVYSMQSIIAKQQAADTFVVLQSLVMLYASLTGLATMASNFGSILGFFETFFSLPSPLEQDDEQPKKHIKKIKTIELRSVSFGYPKYSTILNNLNFKIQLGEKVAIIGRNGAGKSTVAKILLGLLNPTDGQVRVDGIRLQDIDLGEYRKRITSVFQHFGKFEFTVQESVSIGLNANDEDNVWLKANDTQFGVEFKDMRQQQLGTRFGGLELSGGQWQKLAILRAIVRPNDVIILDEPNASLDIESERAISQLIQNEWADSTIIMITHRVHRINEFDRVIFIEEGEIKFDDAPHNIPTNALVSQFINDNAL